MSASSPRRLIDSLPTRPRRTPMKVLCLGLSRTGTDSLRLALKILGYNAYHMYDVITLKHGQYWIEAMDANLIPDHPHELKYGRAEFEKLLHDYDAVADMPMALFGEDFLDSWPDAKVVVTVRDFESWRMSLQRTLFKIFESRAWKMVNYFDRKGFGAMQRSGEQSFEVLADGDWRDGEKLKRGSERHHARVRELVPKGRLLEMRSQDGWKPLCEFLGKEMPSVEYPRTNDAKSWTAFINKMFVIKCAEAVVKILVAAGGPVLVLAVVWKYWVRSG